MKTEVKFFTFSAVFSLGVGAVYWYTSYERTGTVLLLFMFLAPIFVGGYLAWRAWSLRRPEDEPQADHAREAGATLGHFPAASLWPFMMGIGSAVALEGLIFGRWLSLAGVALFAAAGVGLARESHS